ncbi:MAG: nucleotide sugar dehydrogenase [Proteobacteria bacterium]|nr:nucleotide sugar dehydrogenase [Pseudomonadota bacterium]
MIKNICCIGAGYVGGPTMAVIAENCPDIKVTLVDSNPDKIAAWNGPLDKLPVYEPGLKEIVERVRGKNLFFSNDTGKHIDDSEMIFIAVNTPTKTKGEGAGMAADLKYVIACAKQIAEVSKSDKIIVEKSTLPVRTAEKIKEVLNRECKNGVNFEILSNPEFLAEGTAIKDLYKSDRVLIGGDDTNKGQIAVKKLVNIYKRWIPETKILTLNVWSAELAKLASNAMLAQRISSINSLSAICEATGAEIDEVSNAVGRDHRIGSYFLRVSPGFGGSCFQKDILNLVYLSKFYGLHEVAEYWHQVIKINDYQRLRIVDKIVYFINKNKLNKEISILGWSFKKDTNDSRESSSIYIAYELLKMNFKIAIYDPIVSPKRIFEDLKSLNNQRNKLDENIIDNNIKVCLDLNDIKKPHSIAVVMTEWEDFKNLDYLGNKMFLFDFRNYIDKNKTTIRF